MVVKGIAGKMPIVTRGHSNVNVIEVSVATQTVLAIHVSIHIICNKIESN